MNPNSTWHDDDSGQCDADDANPLNDPDCGRWGNDLYFNWENQNPSIPNENWVHLLARGWSVVPPKNFVLANGNQNPCNTNTQCFTDTFNQPKQLATSSVDFLLMTDTRQWLQSFGYRGRVAKLRQPASCGSRFQRRPDGEATAPRKSRNSHARAVGQHRTEFEEPCDLRHADSSSLRVSVSASDYESAMKANSVFIRFPRHDRGKRSGRSGEWFHSRRMPL